MARGRSYTPFDTNEMPESYSRSVRKIDNGYITVESSQLPGRDYKSTETSSAEQPPVRPKPPTPDVSSLARATAYLKDNK